MNDEERWERGSEMFTEVVGIPAPHRGDDYMADVVIDQVFAEIWTRPGLTRKERRWIAMSCACMSGAREAMEFHLGAALRSGDVSIDEVREFVIQFAVYAGHPRATAVRGVLDKVLADMRAP